MFLAGALRSSLVMICAASPMGFCVPARDDILNGQHLVGHRRPDRSADQLSSSSVPSQASPTAMPWPVMVARICPGDLHAAARAQQAHAPAVAGRAPPNPEG